MRFAQLQDAGLPQALVNWARSLLRQMEALPSKGILSRGSVTLAASATETRVDDGACKAGAKLVLMPTTANAAAALTGIYTAGVVDGSFRIGHASAASTDRTFDYQLF